MKPRIKEIPSDLLAARKEVGAAIRKARQLRKLTSTELADMVGISQGTISKLEAAHWSPTLDQVNRVASTLGVKLVVIDPLDQSNERN